MTKGQATEMCVLFIIHRNGNWLINMYVNMDGGDKTCRDGFLLISNGDLSRNALIKLRRQCQ
jgi:hypothetical protein